MFSLIVYLLKVLIHIDQTWS